MNKGCCDHFWLRYTFRLSKGWFPYDRGSQIAIRSAIVCDPAIVIAEDRTMFYLKAGFHMITDRRSQWGLRSSAIIWKLLLRSSAILRSWSQKIEPCSISCDRLRSIAIVCDLRSYGNQSLDRTWFFLLRSSAITIAEVVSIWSQAIADLIAICDHMETSLKRITLTSSCVCL